SQEAGELQRKTPRVWDGKIGRLLPLLYHPSRISAPPDLDMIRLLDIVHTGYRISKAALEDFIREHEHLSGGQTGKR
ncbi:MAG: hypothetical protein ACLQUY_29220, partial [Ktedonobacterales bacterium]